MDNALEGTKKIVEKILADAESEAGELRSFGLKKEEEILKEAKMKADTIKKEILNRGEREVVTEKNRVLSQTRLEMKKRILDAKEREINKVIEKTKELISDPKKIPNFEKVIEQLALEAGTAIGGGDLIYKTDRAGKNVLDKIKGRLESMIKKETDVKTHIEVVDGGAAGVLVESKKFGVVVDNTFITRLERRKREIRKELAAILF
ncbi:MAG: V-type ATP synthase subunit E [Candidatus Methanofastidiosia archaeon]